MPETPPPPFQVSVVQTPTTPADLERYKQIRLESLLEDAQWFGSNYQREANFSEEEWRDRLDGPGKATFVASVPPTAALPHLDPPTPSAGSSPTGITAPSTNQEAAAAAGVPPKQGSQAREGSTASSWVGMVTVLGPEALKTVPIYSDARLKSVLGGSSKGAVYVIVGAWVRPAFRRNGIMQALMGEALSWVQNDGDRAPEGGPADVKKTRKKIVMLAVYASNKAARGAYRRCGFEELETPSSADEAEGAKVEIWMAHRLGLS